MSIDKYDVLRYAETLNEEDLQLLREHLTLIHNVKYPVVYDCRFIGEIPESEKHTSNKSIKDRMNGFKDFLEKDMAELNRKSFIDIPPLTPTPPKMVWRNCVCGIWKAVQRSACTCGGGRFVPEDEL